MIRFLNARPNLCALICLAITAVAVVGLWRLEMYAMGGLG